MPLKKVLIITYYWPPAGGPGVQRWLKFVKYLPEFGIEPIVYCPENPRYPIMDPSLLEEVSESITLLKQPIREPYGIASVLSKKQTKTISSGVISKSDEQSLLQKLMLFIRGNFFIPDARKNWVKPSVRFLSKYLSSNNVVAVITTGPPHSLHLIGLGLKEKLGVKWIADFRDPWTTIGYHKSLKLTPRSKSKHLKLESKVLNMADDIVVTSAYTKREFEAKTDRPISLITNGYDSHSVQINKKDDLFTIAHIGSLLSERNPTLLWQVLSELLTENKEFARLFRLRLVGVVSSHVMEKIKAYKLEDHSEIIGYVSHDDAIKFQMKSQVLLLIEIDSEDTKAIIPGKLFEYLVSGTPIIAIGPQQSDIEQIISSTNTGSYFTYAQKTELKANILDLFHEFQNESLEVHPIGLEPYSRKELTKRLASLI
jgi:glycosyltransferase involved in cell wall biosynthesis